MLGHISQFRCRQSGCGQIVSGRDIAIRRVATQSRARKAVIQHAAVDTTGGSGTFDGGAGRRGGGGDGGGNEGEGDDRRSRRGVGWKGWEERVAADPRFPFKVFLEQVIGVGAAVVGDMMSRPNWGMNELDFVFSTLVVGSIMNFSLMYLLAPTVASVAGGTSQGLIAKLLSEQTLKSRGIPGGHMFEPGAYSIGARALNVVCKGLMFGVIGTLAGIVGTSMSNGLLILRKKFDPDFKLQNEAPNIFYNAAAWGIHMGVSSNLRYQAINGLEMVIQPRLPLPVFAVLSAMYRTANNLLGGVSFVAIAKLIGAQKAAGPEEVIATSVTQAAQEQKRKLKNA